MPDDTSRSVWIFDLARAARARGRWAELLGLVCFAATPLASPPPLRIALAAVGATAAAAGALMLLRRDTVCLSAADRMSVRRTGFGPLVRVTRSPITASERLLVTQRDRVDALGERVEVCDLCIGGSGGRLPLCSGRPAGDAANLAREIGFRLGLALEAAPGSAARSRAADRVLAVAVWAAMAGVLIFAVRPVLNGSAFRVRRPSAAMGQMPVLGASRLARAFQLYTNHNYRGAEADLKATLEVAPDSAEAHNLLAYALAEQNKLDEALKEGTRALDLAPDSGDILDTVGEMHQRRREWKAAAAYYRLALAHEEFWSMTETRVKYAQTLLALGQRADAVDYLRQACEAPGPHQRASDAALWTQKARHLLADLTRAGRRTH